MRVFIIGTTAVGKTKLSVELAKHFGGEVISCDSKQLYKHASIMTAKVTEEQAAGVPHFMVDCLNLHENTYNRNKYFLQAHKFLKNIQGRKRLPVIVGGTNYYIETLLYNLKNLKDTPEQDEEAEQSDSDYQKPKSFLSVDKKLTVEQSQQLQAMRKLSKQQKYALLEKHDKLMAERVHRNDEKKLTIFLQRVIVSGQKMSQSYERKKQELRHKQSVVFWIRNSNKAQLHQMVTKRIYKMLDKNGLAQIFSVYYYIELWRMQNKQEIDLSVFEEYSGAASSIGIREFKSIYQEVRDQIQLLFADKAEAAVKQPLDYNLIHATILSGIDQLPYKEETLAACRDQLILDTKHYCKRQITWIKNRIFVDSQHNRQHFFVLDLSPPEIKEAEQKQPTHVLERFDRFVSQKSIEIIEKIQKQGFGSVLQDKVHFSVEDKIEPLKEWKKYYCEACRQEFNGQYYWNEHVASKRHAKQVKYLEKKQENQQYIQEQKESSKIRKKEKNEKKEQLKKEQEWILEEFQQPEVQKKEVQK